MECLIYGVTMTTHTGKDVFAVPHLCDVVGFIWYGVEKLSIFAVVLLNITRTISLFCPFFNIRKKVVIGIMTFLTTLPFFFFGYIFVRGGRFEYFHNAALCNFYAYKVFDLKSRLFRAYFGTMLFLFHVVPMFIMIACLVLSTAKLLQRRNQTANTESKNRATITILILGTVYTVLNIPYNFLYLAYLLYMWKILDPVTQPFYTFDSYSEYKAAYVFEDFSFIITVMLNPAINILVCVFRVRNLKAYTIDCLRCRWKRRRRKSSFGPALVTFNYNLCPDAVIVQNSVTQNSTQFLSISLDDVVDKNITVIANPSAESLNKIPPTPPIRATTRVLPKVPNYSSYYNVPKEIHYTL